MEFGELLKQLLVDLQALFRAQTKNLNLTLPQIILISSIPMEIENSFLILLLRNTSILNFYSIDKVEKNGDEQLFSLIGNNRKNMFKKIKIYIINGKLSKFIFVSGNNELIELELMNVLINKNLADKNFIFNVPNNTEIIDQK